MDTCSYCGWSSVPGATCGLRLGEPKPGSVYGDDPAKPRMCAYGLVEGRIGVIAWEDGRPVLVLPGDARTSVR